jgi:hypothetical protein
MKTRWSPSWNNRLLDSSCTRMTSPAAGLLDLRSRLGEVRLAQLVLESVQDVTVPDGEDGCCGHSRNGLPSAILLTLLTYSYAAGYFASADVEGELGRDDVLRYLAAGHRPQFDDFRQFRRRCRSELRRCLARVLRRTWERGIEPVGAGETNQESNRALAVNRWEPTGFDARFELEADARIARAVQADSFALDD